MSLELTERRRCAASWYEGVRFQCELDEGHGPAHSCKIGTDTQTWDYDVALDAATPEGWVHIRLQKLEAVSHEPATGAEVHDVANLIVGLGERIQKLEAVAHDPADVTDKFAEVDDDLANLETDMRDRLAGVDRAIAGAQSDLQSISDWMQATTAHLDTHDDKHDGHDGRLAMLERDPEQMAPGDRVKKAEADAEHYKQENAVLRRDLACADHDRIKELESELESSKDANDSAMREWEQRTRAAAQEAGDYRRAGIEIERDLKARIEKLEKEHQADVRRVGETEERYQQLETVIEGVQARAALTESQLESSKAANTEFVDQQTRLIDARDLWRKRAEQLEQDAEKAHLQVVDLRNDLKARLLTNAEIGGPAFELLDIDFLAAMARQLAAGNKREGREADDWRHGDAMFRADRHSAIKRHSRKAHGRYLDDTGESHYAAVACNCMMLHVLTKPTENKKEDK